MFWKKEDIAQKFTILLCSVSTCLTLSAPISLQSPRYQEVFQRDGSDSAMVSLKGTAPAGIDEIRIKADLSATAPSGSTLPWTTILQGTQLKSGAFEGCFKMPKGGWYSLSVEARANNIVVALDSVTRFGVGDVFITAGQSNAANFGETAQTAQKDLVVYFNGEQFIHAADPIPGSFGGGGSIWCLLGDTLAGLTGCPLCFRGATLTFTPVISWFPHDGTGQFDTLYQRTNAFGINGVKAVLWVQGESDALAQTTAQDYCNRLCSVIDSLRSRIGYAFDWFVSGTSFHPDAIQPAIDAVYQGQQYVWSRGCAFQGPYTNDLLGPAYRWDGVHFSVAGLAEEAARWYAILAAHYWPETSCAPPATLRRGGLQKIIQDTKRLHLLLNQKRHYPLLDVRGRTLRQIYSFSLLTVILIKM